MAENAYPSMRELARRLLALEAARPSPLADGLDTGAHEAVRVCEKLRISLTRIAGADSFAALMGRSLALARLEAPSLNRVDVRADCSMDGLQALAAEEADRGVEAATALVAHLLELLATFIGVSLTVRMVTEAWPDALRDIQHL